jgi:hypothetical protein
MNRLSRMLDDEIAAVTRQVAARKASDAPLPNNNNNVNDKVCFGLVVNCGFSKI